MAACRSGLLEHVQGTSEILARYGEGYVCDPVAAGGLNDHVHHYPGFAQRAEDARGRTRAILHVAQCYPCLILVKSDARNEHGFHHVILLGDQRAGIIRKRGAHADRDIVFFCKFNGTYLQDLGAHRGKLQHLIIADPVDFMGVFAHARIGRIDPVDIRIDVTDGTVAQGGGNGHGGCVGTSPPKRGEAHVAGHSLEAGYDKDVIGLKGAAQLVGADAVYARIAVRFVRDDGDLKAEERA